MQRNRLEDGSSKPQTPETVVSQIDAAIARAKKSIKITTRPHNTEGSLRCADDLGKKMSEAARKGAVATFSFDLPKDVASYYIITSFATAEGTPVYVPEAELEESVNLSRYIPAVVPGLLINHVARRIGADRTPQAWHYRLVGIDLAPKSIRQQLPGGQSTR